MNIDAKQKVLLAIYAEYQKDLPVMESVTHQDLGIGSDVFNIAVDKLQSEGFITNVSIQHGGRSSIPLVVWLNNCKMTRFGIDYVERFLEIEATLSGEQKIKGFIEKSTLWGWEQLKDFGAKTLAEILKS